MLEILFTLIAAHAVCDYPLQGNYLAQTKSPSHELNKVIPFIWVQSLTAHSIIHGGAVLLITSVWWLGLFEAVTHWITDYLKCKGRISYHFDQFIHLAFKCVWAAILYLTT